jgi:flavin-dependent dehydrogenase
MEQHSPRRREVVIIGGGPGGTTCAMELARLGHEKVTVLESGVYDAFRIGESMPPEIRPILVRLGILEGFLAQGHEPCYGSCSYWGDDRRGYNDSIMSVYGHGWHVDRCRFNRFLAEGAIAADAELMIGCTFVAAEARGGGGYRLSARRQGNDDDTCELVRLDADFVVDASGARGIFARQQGSRKQEDRPLICLGARFRLQDGEQRITKMTHLESVSYGWWYAARLPDDVLLVALSTDAVALKSLELQRRDTWMQALKSTSNTVKLIANAELIDSQPRAYPAPSFRLDRMTGSHWLALGDAASSFDPITSQGIIKSMSEAQLAAETIHACLRGREEVLESYERALADRFEHYVSMRRYLYRRENRWPRSPFWMRQQAQ